MPTGSPDYKTISEFNEIVHNGNQIKAKDLIAGATYLTKDNTELIYVGKFDYYSSGYKWFQNGEYKTSKNSRDIPRSCGSYSYCDYEYINNFDCGKYFWFAWKCEGDWRFEKFKSIPKAKFIKCVNEKCTEEYSEIHKALDNSCEYSPYDEGLDKMTHASLESFIAQGKEKHWRDNSFYYTSFKFICETDGDYETYAACPRSGDENLFTVKKYHKRDVNRGSYGFLVGFLATLEEIYEKMKPMYKQCYLKNGNEYRKEWGL